jgi:hypothetical protein
MNGKMIMKTIHTAFFPPDRSSRLMMSEIRAMKIQIAMIQKKNRIEYQKTSRNVVSAKTIFLLSEGHCGAALPGSRFGHRPEAVTTYRPVSPG